MEVVVFGAGSLGSLVGSLLDRTHDVTLVGREPHVSAVRVDGLRVSGAETFVAHPAATTDGTELEADLAVVTVKSFDTQSAAQDLATGAFEAALSLQNGMGNEDVLAEQLACPVLAGSTSHGAVLREPGLVEWTGRGDVAMGAWRPAETPVVERVAAAFDESGLSPRVVDDMRTELWLKLGVNTAINPITALVRAENGTVRAGPATELARAAARETARTARAEGVDVTDSDVVKRVEVVAEATAENRSSMLQDVTAGSRTEIDQLNGFVVDRAAEHDIDVPVNRVLSGLVRAWEADRGLR